MCVSPGWVRGKSDKIDAKRIAGYGYEKQSKLEAETGGLADIVRFKLRFCSWVYWLLKAHLYSVVQVSDTRMLL
ncbi:MAG: hypothetical protein ABI921_07405 [Panacibacter sp.]